MSCTRKDWAEGEKKNLEAKVVSASITVPAKGWVPDEADNVTLIANLVTASGFNTTTHPKYKIPCEADHFAFEDAVDSILG
jgi:hypothetical protein